MSPCGLIQEQLAHMPWRMLVACVLLNQTSYKQVRPVLDRLFERYDDQRAMAQADSEELSALIRNCGLQNRRAMTLIRMSDGCCRPGWELDVGSIFGVGKYALDSWHLFRLKDLAVEPTDKELIKYVTWARLHLG